MVQPGRFVCDSHRRIDGRSVDQVGRFVRVIRQIEQTRRGGGKIDVFPARIAHHAESRLHVATQQFRTGRVFAALVGLACLIAEWKASAIPVALGILGAVAIVYSRVAVYTANDGEEHLYLRAYAGGLGSNHSRVSGGAA